MVIQKRRWLRLLHGLMLLLVGSCVDPYRPPEVAAPNRYLVVDGHLNGGVGESVIKLSRTQNVGDFNKPAPESKASVRVEGENKETYTFTEGASGTYALASTTLPFGNKYRLRIKTTDGNEYVSDLVTIKQTPRIDSVTWGVENNGLQIFVNSHDPAGKTRYYRWEYEDTYEILTPYISPYDFKNNRVVQRLETNINHCWRTQPSTNIIVGSTSRLTADIVQRAPILFIPGTSPKLSIKYSILVRQYAQSPEAYTYWQTLQKNTEQLGSLFDPLPSQVAGNMHSVTNSAEPVLGFVDGYSTEQLRVFIDRPAALPRNQIITGYEGCRLDTIPRDMVTLAGFLGTGGYVAIIQLSEGSYLGTGANCADCRSLGTTTKPSYWP